MMSVRRRLLIHLLVLLGSVGGLAGIAIVGVAWLRDDFSVALSANQQLRELYSIGAHVSAARSALRDNGDVDRELEAAQTAFELAEAQLADLPQTRSIRSSLQAAADAPAGEKASIAAQLNAVFSDLADASASLRQQIMAHQQSADRLHRRTLLAIVLTALAALLAMLLLAARQYRAIVRPLAALAGTTRRLSAGDFAQRVAVTGDAEFVSLATSFNQMADELAAIHADLERRVATKSRELGQAQRLASIGYLAAGVAHEINNPLGIIAGYGQRTLRRLDDALDVEKVRQSLGVICDEVFRCKKITERLLMLARPAASTARGPVDLPLLIEQTIATLATLRPLEGRDVTSAIDSRQLGPMTADADALRQVLLNLLINAVEATSASDGRIAIEARRDMAMVELIVRDNGRGIAADRLPHIFEPFVTDQRGDRPGTGLGLAIALSIISDHAGTISARSPGIGRGCEFVVRLPVQP